MGQRRDKRKKPMHIAALALAASTLAAPAFAQGTPVAGIGDVLAPMVRAMRGMLGTTLLNNLQLIGPGARRRGMTIRLSSLAS
jgi:hypothetical protein